jgi:hypothetical protein
VEIPGRRSWTELFFLDEAVVLAAGHRPCFRCRHEAAEAFRAAWMAAVGKQASSAAAMDVVLHRERMEHGRKLIHAVPGPLSELQDGAVIAMSGSAFTVSGGQAFGWTEYGYERPYAKQQTGPNVVDGSRFMQGRVSNPPWRNRRTPIRWQRGHYEHVIRNEKALDRIRAYIANNPARWADDPENISRAVSAEAGPV